MRSLKRLHSVSPECCLSCPRGTCIKMYVFVWSSVSAGLKIKVGDLLSRYAIRLFICLLVSRILHHNHNFTSLLSSQSIPTRSSPPPFPFRKGQRFTRISTKHGIPNYNRTRHLPSYWGWMRQLSRREKVQFWLVHLFFTFSAINFFIYSPKVYSFMVYNRMFE